MPCVGVADGSVGQDRGCLPTGSVLLVGKVLAPSVHLHCLPAAETWRPVKWVVRSWMLRDDKPIRSDSV